MSPARVAWTLAVALGAGACASVPPTVDLEPVSAQAAELPIAWFAEQWGPFDASLVGRVSDGPGFRPLLIQDGLQVTADTEMKGDVYAALTDRESEGGFRLVRVIRHECDTRHFGPAGVHGVILAFSTDYDGPLPGPGHAWDRTPCEGAAGA